MGLSRATWVATEAGVDDKSSEGGPLLGSGDQVMFTCRNACQFSASLVVRLGVNTLFLILRQLFDLQLPMSHVTGDSRTRQPLQPILLAAAQTLSVSGTAFGSSLSSNLMPTQPLRFFQLLGPARLINASSHSATSSQLGGPCNPLQSVTGRRPTREKHFPACKVHATPCRHTCRVWRSASGALASLHHWPTLMHASGFFLAENAEPRCNAWYACAQDLQRPPSRAPRRIRSCPLTLAHAL